ncbi:hypothetical protein [Streptomyces sp. NPDC089799]|uniref:hypothetical protein n=1 Tax=Streptomyces sp. NPDC089799 TaxID=3155066 RepID=UPI003421A241
MLWALGGVLAASAVWAGGLYAYGDELAAPQQAYRLPETLCKDFRPAALSRTVPGLRDFGEARGEQAQETLDWVVCETTGESEPTPSGDRVRYVLRVEAERHKKTDPAVEFGLGIPVLDVSGNSTVSGLGDKAILNTTPAGREPVLRVVDHEAVFTIRMTALSLDERGSPAGDVVTDNVDYDEVKYAMIEDMRKLMDATRK